MLRNAIYFPAIHMCYKMLRVRVDALAEGHGVSYKIKGQLLHPLFPFTSRA